MNANVYPVKLELAAGDRLLIDWSDGVRLGYSYRTLRDSCPCATCREKRSEKPADPLQLPVLSAAETQPLKIDGMKPLGNYAYSIAFSDGHDTGIYTFEHLLAIGEPAA